LLPKGTKCSWESEQQSAFESLQSSLTSTLVLAFPLPEHTFILDIDASNTSIGAVLSQVQDGTERVVSFASRRFTPAQEKYCVTRKELLAVVSFTEKFKHYLLG